MTRAAARVLLALAILALLAVLGLAAAFAVENRHWVVVRVPVPALRFGAPVTYRAFEAPLAVLLGGAVLAGALLGWLVALPRTVRGAYRRRRERRRVAALERELRDLRAIVAGAAGGAGDGAGGRDARGPSGPGGEALR